VFALSRQRPTSLRGHHGAAHGTSIIGSPSLVGLFPIKHLTIFRRACIIVTDSVSHKLRKETLPYLGQKKPNNACAKSDAPKSWRPQGVSLREKVWG
jgi:hypothetical protein